MNQDRRGRVVVWESRRTAAIAPPVAFTADASFLLARTAGRCRLDIRSRGLLLGLPLRPPLPLCFRYASSRFSRHLGTTPDDGTFDGFPHTRDRSPDTRSVGIRRGYRACAPQIWEGAINSGNFPLNRFKASLRSNLGKAAKFCSFHQCRVTQVRRKEKRVYSRCSILVLSALLSPAHP